MAGQSKIPIPTLPPSALIPADETDATPADNGRRARARVARPVTQMIHYLAGNRRPQWAGGKLGTIDFGGSTAEFVVPVLWWSTYLRVQVHYVTDQDDAEIEITVTCAGTADSVTGTYGGTPSNDVDDVQTAVMYVEIGSQAKSDFGDDTITIEWATTVDGDTGTILGMSMEPTTAQPPNGTGVLDL